MRLAAVYNVWGDQELLAHSIKHIRPLVDGIIVVYSTISNFGEVDPNFDFLENVEYIVYHPQQISPRENETSKRNAGLSHARKLGYTHFLMMDADEFYEPTKFIEVKDNFMDDLNGLVCRVKCYFKSTTLTIGYDTTLVPFIHKITPDLKFEFNKNYPFAWTDTDSVPFTPKKRIRIDPTRSMNITSGVEWSDIVMHHMSWVRSDIMKKIRNSTARQNLEQSTIVQDYLHASPGYFCQFYGKILEECPNVFRIPEITDTNVKHPSLHQPK